MSFKLFIYYCGICGGWAAFLAWGIQDWRHFQEIDNELWRTTSISSLMGLVLAGAVGTIDALLNSVRGQRWMRVLVCLGVGFLGGGLGGYLGQRLANQGLPRFLGWIMVGIAIGASIGVFDFFQAFSRRQSMRSSARKLLNGLIGGAIGGGLGGLLFEGMASVLGSRRSSLAAGFVILGISIGLLIGLAQIILTEAWIKIEQGFRPGRERMLAKAETTIGRAESCDIGLFGDPAIERIHARIRLHGNHYLLVNNGNSATFLNDQPVTQPSLLRSGDLIRIGKSVLRFGERQKRNQ
ncbi:MAG TPA: FHA domain-containing protein [Gemmataceae bacterium]|nr:FHA domain-containing protein [Gemmataceae bacterium]